jgi:hypothetical protein
MAGFVPMSIILEEVGICHAVCRHLIVNKYGEQIDNVDIISLREYRPE